jgi:type 1 fimbria pilin
MRKVLEFEDIMSEAQKKVRDLKGTQYAGASNIRIYLSSSVNTYDASVTLNDIFSPGNTHTFIVSWENEKQPFALSDISVREYVDGTDLLNIKEPGMTGYAGIGIAPYNKSDSDPLLNEWDVTISNYDTVAHTYYLKFYFQSTDDGA